VDVASVSLSHLRREVRTALELAVIALAPTALVDALAAAAGLLEAATELPADSAPVVAIEPRVRKRARGALDEWKAWYDAYLAGRVPRV
jgi:hypothetical protein